MLDETDYACYSTGDLFAGNKYWYAEAPMANLELSPEIPLIVVQERLPITLFDTVALAVRGEDGLIYRNSPSISGALALG
jgi:hypothetical protein